MKEEYIEIANETLQDYNIKITTNGHRHPGAAVGSNQNKEEFVKSVRMGKATGSYTKFAYAETHAAFSSFIHGLRHWYTYFMRTIHEISDKTTR